MRKHPVLASALFLCCAAAISQAAEPVPLITDLPPGYDLADRAILDIRGIDLGQSAEEARAALVKFFSGGGSTLGRRALEASDGYRSVHFVVDEKEKVVSPPGRDPEEIVSVEYTTPTSGVRVMGVHWWARYLKQAPSFTETLAEIEKRYGTPSYATGSMTIRLFYVWFDGKLAAGITPEEVEAADAAKTATGGPAWCISGHGLEDFGSNRAYSETPITDRAPGCSVVLMVELQRNGDSVFTLSEDLFDYRRWFDNSLADSGWLRAKLAEMTPR